MNSPRAGRGGVTPGRAIAIALAMIASSAAAALAEPVHLLRTTDAIPFPKPPGGLRDSPHRTLDVAINRNGDLEVRCREVTLTMAYSPPEELQRSQDHIRIAQKQEVPAISGISIRVSMAF